MPRVLITGGAGFIGRRLSRDLFQRGYLIRILDNLHPQVHGPGARIPPDLVRLADVQVGDITDAAAVRAALADVDIIIHLAAETGPAQSMYEIERYVRVNIHGTAILLQEIQKLRNHIKRLVVASSRAVYGEGKYECAKHGNIFPEARSEEQLSAGYWDPVCSSCGSSLRPLPSDEQSLPQPTTIYAVTKLAQENMALAFGRAYNISTIALRYQNVYGAGQSLGNPYIGVLSIFCARALAGLSISLYEDGKMIRDFIHVDDAVRATVLAAEFPKTIFDCFNVGSGNPCEMFHVVKEMAAIGGFKVPVEVTGEYRTGDIRHCFADLTRIHHRLGYEPEVDLRSGLEDLILWAKQEPGIISLLDKATNELANEGLFRKAKKA